MRWLPHDLGFWGFILAVLALVLAIPFGIMSALLAPKFQVWWATRSIKSTAQKLVKLAQYLADLEQEPLLTFPEMLIIEQQLRITYSIYFVGYLLLLVLLEGLGTDPVTHHFKPRFVALGILILFMGSGCFTYAIVKTKLHLRRISPRERGKLEKEIESVRQKFLALAKDKN